MFDYNVSGTEQVQPSHIFACIKQCNDISFVLNM